MWIVFNLIVLVFLVCALLKLMAIRNAIRWASYYGARYVEAYSTSVAKEPPPGELRGQRIDLELFEAHDGDFFPFGAKDYKLRRFYQGRPDDSPILRRIRRVVRVLGPRLFGSRHLIVTALVLGVVSNIFSRSRGKFAELLANLLSASVVAICFTLMIEALVWYLSVGAYARPYYMVRFKLTPVGNPVIEELWVYMRIVIYNVASIVVSCSVAQVSYSSFSGVEEAPGVGSEIERLSRFAYFAVASLTTVGDGGITPKGAYGSLLATSILVQTLLVVLFALSVVGPIIVQSRPRT